MHVAPAQFWLTAQAFPHVPQLALSICTSVQTDPQPASPPAQVQTPFWQL